MPTRIPPLTRHRIEWGARQPRGVAYAADECLTALAGGFSFKDQTMTELDIHYRTAFDFRATDDETVSGFEGYASTHWAADSILASALPAKLNLGDGPGRNAVPSCQLRTRDDP